MFRFGVCTSIDNIESAAQLGYDFIECSFSWLGSINDETFDSALKRVDSSHIRVEACNGMLPANLSIVGPNSKDTMIREYLSKTYKRASKMGVNVVVFGSGSARNVPAGFPHEKAWREIIEFLHISEEYGKEYGINVAIEPLRRKECNILNYVSEGVLLASALNSPYIGVLGDTHHMICGNEPFEALTYAGKLLKHIHISHSYGNDGERDYPSVDDGYDYGEIFKTLSHIGYTGRVSIEAICNNFVDDGRKAMEVIKQYR